MNIECRTVGPLATNCYILSCPESRKAVIIDPGGDPGTIRMFIEQEKLEVQEIIATHGHSDHIAYAAELARTYRVGFAVHADDAEIVKLSVKEAPFWGMGSIEEPVIGRTLEPGTAIEFGNVSGSILHTPGHTPGGVSFLFDGAVLVGDTLFAGSVGRTDLLGGNFEVLLESIRTKLLTLPEETAVWCGHGPATTIGEEKKYNPFVTGYL